MLKKILTGLVLVLGLTACGGVPQNAQQSVFEIKSTYGVVLNAAANYAELPLCSDAQKQPCADKKVVDQLKKAEPGVRTTLDAAENVVRTPGFGESVVSTAIAAAQAALKAFSTLVPASAPKAAVK